MANGLHNRLDLLLETSLATRSSISNYRSLFHPSPFSFSFFILFFIIFIWLSHVVFDPYHLMYLLLLAPYGPSYLVQLSFHFRI